MKIARLMESKIGLGIWYTGWSWIITLICQHWLAIGGDENAIMAAALMGAALSFSGTYLLVQVFLEGLL